MSYLKDLGKKMDAAEAAKPLKFTKVTAGWYATADGHYAVVIDGYEKSKSVAAEADRYEGFTGGEWSAIHDPAAQLRDDHNAGNTLDWFPTKRDAIARCRSHHEARVRFAEALASSSDKLWRE